MYGIVLATAMMTSTAAPDFGWRGCHGCYGCSCYGCYGCCGCWGCHGCYGCSCYGYCGCYGCWGCSGCYGCYGCGGCWGGGCYGCWGCYAPAVTYSYCYGGYGCNGCCGGYMVRPPVVVPPGTGPMPKVIEGDKGDKGGKGGKVIEGDKIGTAQSPAIVVLKAPADVKITVNGTAIERRTTEETFLTPSLPAGQNFAYVFAAEATRDGKTVTKTERITVRAGMQSEVDFTNLDRATATADVARVTVMLPAGARLYVNDIAVSATSTQTFETPKLEKGKKFFYTVRAEVQRDGRTVSDNQRVSVEAGKSVTVDFTRASSTLTASR